MKLLLIEDNKGIAKGLEFSLQGAGYETELCHNCEQAYAKIGGDYAVIIIDISLPDGNGFDLYKDIRRVNSSPVIFLTAKDTENDIVQGLDMGADDYMIKPFRNRELISRINNVLRRTGKTQKMITIGEVSIDAENDKVFVKGAEVTFTALEYKILLMLFQNKGRVVTRGQILDKIWDAAGNFVEDNTLTVYIKRIREKLGDADVIKTVKGMGYRVE